MTSELLEADDENAMHFADSGLERLYLDHGSFAGDIVCAHQAPAIRLGWGRLAVEHYKHVSLLTQTPIALGPCNPSGSSCQSRSFTIPSGYGRAIEAGTACCHSSSNIGGNNVWPWLTAAGLLTALAGSSAVCQAPLPQVQDHYSGVHGLLLCGEHGLLLFFPV